MKLYLHESSDIFSSTVGSRKAKLQKSLIDLANAWKSHANVDIEISDDADSITYPDKNNNPCVQRITMKLVPEYHLFNVYQDEIAVTTDLDSLISTMSDVISEDRNS